MMGERGIIEIINRAENQLPLSLRETEQIVEHYKDVIGRIRDVLAGINSIKAKA